MSIYGSSSILTCLVLLPVIGSLLLSLLPSSRLRLIRISALALLTGMMAITIAAACLFNWSATAGASPPIQLQQQMLWLPSISMYYHVGVDSLSMPSLLVLIALALLAGIASSNIQHDAKRYYILLILLTGFAAGTLVSLDLMLFACFFQLMVIPAYFLIALWGKQRREPVAMKYALFHTLGSVLILSGIMILCVAARHAGLSSMALNIPNLAHSHRFLQLFGPAGNSFRTGQIIFWLFFAGLATRFPTLVFHLWIPDTAAEGPSSAMLLLIPASVIIGGYGILRIIFPLLPFQLLSTHMILAELGVAGMVYGGICALAQNDLKKLYGYWMLSQAGYVLLGMGLLNTISIEGALVQMIGVAVTMAMLLWIAEIIDRRAHHCEVNRLGGLAWHMPGFFGVSGIGLLAALGLPGLSLFAGQILVIMGAFDAHGILSYSTHAILWTTPVVMGIIAAATMVLTAAYILWTIEQVYLGRVRPEFHHFQPLALTERLVLLPLAAAIISLGVFPGMILLKPWAPAASAMIAQLIHTLGH